MSTETARSILFTPNDAVEAALRTIEERRSYIGAGTRIGVADIDNYLLPGRPGELITVMGMTSNYKSGLMQYWARHTANEIIREQLVNECVVYVTWEQAIEEMVAFDLSFTARLSATDVVQGKVSDAEMTRLRNVIGPQRAMMPLYLIGHCLSEQQKRPRLSLSAVAQAMVMLKKEYNVKPRAIFLDYLQQIDPEEGDQRRMQVFYNVSRCKDMSLAMGCPVVLGCQANRNVYHEQWGVPSVSDGLESSNIEHTSDKMLGVWYPIKTYDEGYKLETKSNKPLTVTPNLLIVKVLKQKLGPAGKWFPLYVDPAINDIHGMEMHA
jgi:replicative DNA helicase